MISGRLSQFLDEDSKFLVEQLIRPTSPGDSSLKSVNKGTRHAFANYAISVVSQAIGLSGSVAPLNCSREQMLAYLMDALNINQAQLAKFLQVSKSTQTQTIKGYSWRPEIIFRVGQPVFYNKEQEFIKNMTVRVYIFNSQPESESDKTHNTTLPDANRLFRFFQRIRMDPAIRIRPQQEIREELRFNKVNGSMSSLSPKSKNGEQSATEGSLNIRKGDVRSKSAQVLRFEFWLKTSARRFDTCNQLTRYLTGKNLFCPSKREESSENNLRDNEEFYGSINIKMNQIPAYAIKKIYPILSLREQRVNTSEISLEFKNRDIVDETDDRGSPTDNTVTRKQSRGRSSTESLINHIRLYTNCMIFQLISLRKCIETRREKDFDELTCNMTLENLLYLPAHTLTNQHRLQTNLTHLEDQSLRRSAVLLLLVKISQCKASPEIRSILSTFQLVLVTVAEHEYTVAHRRFDGKTMQQVEIPTNNPEMDSSRNSVIDIELEALRSFIGLFRKDLLSKGWISNLDAKGPEVEKTLALSCIRSARSIINHIQINCFVHSRFKNRTQELKMKVQSTLESVVVDHLKGLIESLMAEDNRVMMRPTRQVVTKTNFKLDRSEKSSFRRVDRRPAASNSWEKLSRDIQQIDHDLIIHWSQTGFDSLVIDEPKIFVKGKTVKLKQLIKSMMDRYLAETIHT